MTENVNDDTLKSDFKGLTMIIPAYNESEGLPATLEGLVKIIPPENIIVVNDGSTDNTAECAMEKGVRVLSHKRNRGYGSSLVTGLLEADSEWIMIFDADGQHQASSVHELWAERHDADMVVGVRSGGVPLIRKPGKAVLVGIANYLSGEKIKDLNSGLRLFRRETALQFRHLYPKGFSFTTTSTLCYIESGFEIKWLPIETLHRVGKSQVRPVDAWNMLIVILRTICTFSPLKFFVPLSFALAGGGVAMASLELYISHGLSDSAVLMMVASLITFTTGLLADGVSSLRKDLLKK